MVNDVDILLQNLLAGDLLGFLVACYVTRLGQVFYAIPGLVFGVVLYNKSGTVLYPVLIWLALGSLFMSAIPIISPVAVFLIILALTALFVRLFTIRH